LVSTREEPRNLRLGIWTPLPHTIPPEPRMQAAVDRLTKPGGVGIADPSFEFACDVVSRAEAAGFSTTLIAARFLGPDLEAFMLASALAARTRSIELLVAVHPGIFPPQVVAKMAASLDRLSAGRCALNIVNGWWADEFALFSNGAALDGDGERYLRMREFVDVLQRMLSGTTIDYDGQFYHAQGGFLPIRPARDHIPFYAASRALEGKEVVAELCDLWFTDYAPDHKAFLANFERMRGDVAAMKSRARSRGRALECGISCHVICAPDAAEAERRAEVLLAYAQRDRIAAVAAKGLGAGLVGTPELVASRIRAYYGVGITCLMLHFHPMLDGLQTFVDRVIPLLDDIPIYRAPQCEVRS
jgi:FMNH2-dependent dimethyl sulfone monooxygenase